MAEKPIIHFEPWHGEFGWEIMTWAPQCRLQAADAGCGAVVTSFAGMAPLYDDFAAFQAHDKTGRSLKYFKRYRGKGLHRRYGDAGRATVQCDILIHARGIRRKSTINYQSWPPLVERLKARPVSVGWVGSEWDTALCYGLDLRCRPLAELMDLIAAAKVVVGVSSGLMHLAAACGTDLVVWGDRRTYFGETLERRYKATWNPHHVGVEWIDADDWQPAPQQIHHAIERIL